MFLDTEEKKEEKKVLDARFYMLSVHLIWYKTEAMKQVYFKMTVLCCEQMNI